MCKPNLPVFQKKLKIPSSCEVRSKREGHLLVRLEPVEEIKVASNRFVLCTVWMKQTYLIFVISTITRTRPPIPLILVETS